MIKKITFLILVLYSISVFSQSEKWQEGYIIINNGDTTYGLVKKRSDIANFKIDFKESENAQMKPYTTEEIKSYKWGYLKYISYNGSFIELLIDGYLKLYVGNFQSFRSNSINSLENVHIIQNNQGKFHRLKHNKFTSVVSNKDVLHELIKDYQELADEINNKKIRINEIFGIINRYNKWKKENQ